MDELAQGQTTDDPQDRSLTITCKPTLIWYGTNPPNIGATVVFTQSGSTPNMPNRVSANGDLKLDHIPANSNYNNNVDITIMLDTSGLLDANGNATTGRWANADEGPLMLNEHTGYCWFCTVTNESTRQYDSTPITIADMIALRKGNTEIVVNDDTTDTEPSYAFCLGLVLPEFNNYYITIDPIIGSKGGKN